MRRGITLTALLAMTALAACSKTGENEVQVQTPNVDVENGDVTVRRDSATLTLPDIDLGSKRDTVNAPVVTGTTKDTLIITRPTLGSEKREVKSPTMDVKKP